MKKSPFFVFFECLAICLYELYLPDKKLLQAKVKQWINEYESQVKV